MNDTCRSIPFPFPSAFQLELAELVQSAPMDDLLALKAVVLAELDKREGRQKFTIPPHVLDLLN